MSAPEHGRTGRLSVRVRVTALASLVVLVVLAAAGVAVVRAQELTLLRNLEEGLEQASGDLVAAVRSGSSAGVLAGFGDDDAAYRVSDAGGTTLLESRNPQQTAVFAGLAPPEGASTTVVRSLEFDDARYLVRSETIELSEGAVTTHVAASLDDIDDAVAALRTSFLVLVPAVTLALAGLIWFVVGRSLRPVEAIRAEVAGIGGNQLDRRVPVPAGDDEVARLARTMNGMLERIEEAGERQRRFVADASHELRTPLTRMRAELEVDLVHPVGADLRATHASVLDEVDCLQRLVNDLLQLARADAGWAATGQSVELDRVVDEVIEAARPSTGMALNSSLAPATVTGNADALRRLVTNLVDNALRHAQDAVMVTVRCRGSGIELAVVDNGPGIPESDAERVFERFTRLDTARSQDAGGSGLGLAIAQAVARAHGGAVEVDTAYDGGARLVVTLPDTS